MTTAREMARRFRAIDIMRESSAILASRPDDLADLNRAQLMRGVDKNERTLTRYRNAAYARKKHAMNALPGLGIPDYRLTGETHRTIKALVAQSAIVFHAAGRIEDVIKRDGEDVLGLTDSSKQTAWTDILQPQLVRNIADKTGAKFG